MSSIDNIESVFDCRGFRCSNLGVFYKKMDLILLKSSSIFVVVVFGFMRKSVALRLLIIVASCSIVFGLSSRTGLRSSRSISNSTQPERAFTVALLVSSLKTLISPKNAGALSCVTSCISPFFAFFRIATLP